MGIELAPFFQFLTVQIEARGGQNIWFDLEDGLSIIYGLNGTGKTTIINGINRLFRGEEEKSREWMSNLEYHPGKSRGYFGFPVSLFMCEFAYEVFGEFEKQYPKMTMQSGNFCNFEKFGINVVRTYQDKEESISQFKAWYLDYWLSKKKPIPDRNSIVTELNDVSNSDARLDFINSAVGVILDEAIEKQGHSLLNPFEAHNDFISSLRIAIGTKFTDWEFSKPNAKYANELGSKYGVEFNFDDDTFADRGFADSSSGDLLYLYLYLLIEKFHNAVTEPIDDCDWFSGDEVFEDLFGKGLTVNDCIKDVGVIAKVIFSTIKESLISPVFWFEPSKERSINRIFGLSLDLSVDKSANSSIVQFKKVLTEIQQVANSELESPHKSALTYALTESRLFEVIAMSDFDNFKSEWPYLNLAPQDGIGELSEFPLKVVNVAQTINFDFVAQKTLVNLLRVEGAEASFSMDGYYSEGVIDIPNIEIVNDYMDKISMFLQRLDIGVRRCKFE